MRGRFADQGGLFSYIAPDKRVPANHPLRKVRDLVRDVLSDLNRSLGKLYASEGRPSIPPEQLLSALLLQVFYGIRSERQLMEQLDYNLLYRWFVGLSPDDPVEKHLPAFKGQKRELTAEDVLYPFKRLVDPANKSPGATEVLEEGFVGLEAVRGVDQAGGGAMPDATGQGGLGQARADRGGDFGHRHGAGEFTFGAVRQLDRDHGVSQAGGALSGAARSVHGQQKSAVTAALRVRRMQKAAGSRLDLGRGVG